MLRRTGQWQGNRTPDNQAANKLVDAGGIWFEDVGSTPTASRLTKKIAQGNWIYVWGSSRQAVTAAPGGG